MGFFEDDDEESSSEEESTRNEMTAVEQVIDKAQPSKETEAGAEISALVNYIQPVHFNSFEYAESKLY